MFCLAASASFFFSLPPLPFRLVEKKKKQNSLFYLSTHALYLCLSAARLSARPLDRLADAKSSPILDQQKDIATSTAGCFEVEVFDSSSAEFILSPPPPLLFPPRAPPAPRARGGDGADVGRPAQQGRGLGVVEPGIAKRGRCGRRRRGRGRRTRRGAVVPFEL